MTRVRNVFAISALAAMTALAPTVAEAHLVVTGMGPLVDGVTHFGLSPEDWLPVIALGFFAGLRGPRPARVAMAALACAWFVGALCAMEGLQPPAIVLTGATAAFFCLIGGLLAWNPSAPAWVVAALAMALGLARGTDNFLGASTQFSTLGTLVGICGSVVVAYALAASVTLPLKRLWMVIAARVGGSWVAALGVLLAGWIIRYGNRIH